MYTHMSIYMIYMCIYMCVYIHMYTYIYIQLKNLRIYVQFYSSPLCMGIYIYIYIPTHIHIYIYIYINIWCTDRSCSIQCTYGLVFVNITTIHSTYHIYYMYTSVLYISIYKPNILSIYIYTYIHIYRDMCMYMDIYIYIYMHTHCGMDYSYCWLV